MKILDLFDQFIFDLDGVVYIGNTPTPNAETVISELRKRNKLVTFITNNPTRSPAEYLRKLTDLGIHCSEHEIVTSCQAVNYFLTNELKDIENKTVYVAGSAYLKEQVRITGASIAEPVFNGRADIVVVGSHNEFDYNEIKNASLAVQHGAFYVATNNDSCYPAPEGLLPATGALLASIEAVTGKKPLITGKPGKYIFSYCVHVDPLRTIIIGDSIDTDIKGGINAGIKTALTLTGLTKRSDLKVSVVKPDYVFEDLSELLR